MNKGRHIPGNLALHPDSVQNPLNGQLPYISHLAISSSYLFLLVHMRLTLTFPFLNSYFSIMHLGFSSESHSSSRMFLSQVATASLPLLLQVGHMNFSAMSAKVAQSQERL